MPHDSRPAPHPPVLATDLDGTLIPLEDNDQNRRDLDTLRQHLADAGAVLTFVTGRHLQIVEEAIAEHQLPRPDWIICDVGTSIYRTSPEDWEKVTDYRDHLESLCSPLTIDQLRGELDAVDGLRLQEPHKQGEFKLSYYADQHALPDLAANVQSLITKNNAPYSLISSVDPFTGDGLIDLLPRGVSKAYAVDWWRQHCGIDREQLVFAGDSGNDWAALIAGYRAIVVGNADRDLARRVEAYHASQNWQGRLHLAQAPATSGVLEGCRAFGLFRDAV